MGDDSVGSPGVFPPVRGTVRVEQPFAVVELTTYYRGKTNAYVVERTSLVKILDRSGQTVEPCWNDEWCELAPGIEMQRTRLSRRYAVGGRSMEFVTTGRLRIHRYACPVHLQLCDKLEYVDYDDSSLSSQADTEYWVRYEA